MQRAQLQVLIRCLTLLLLLTRSRTEQDGSALACSRYLVCFKTNNARATCLCVICDREQEDREERDRLRREGKPLPPELARSNSDEYAGERGGRGERGGFGGMFGPPGSHDDSDPFTTNLYVGNIHPEVCCRAARFTGTAV